jgi:hypothetical protein
VPPGNCADDDLELHKTGEASVLLPGIPLAASQPFRSQVITYVRRACTELLDLLNGMGFCELATLAAVDGNRTSLTHCLQRDIPATRRWLSDRRTDLPNVSTAVISMPATQPWCRGPVPTVAAVATGSSGAARRCADAMVMWMSTFLKRREVTFRTVLCCGGETPRDAVRAVRMEAWIEIVQRYLCVATVAEHGDCCAEIGLPGLVSVLDLDLSLLAETHIHRQRHGGDA